MEEEKKFYIARLYSENGRTPTEQEFDNKAKEINSTYGLLYNFDDSNRINDENFQGLIYVSYSEDKNFLKILK